MSAVASGFWFLVFLEEGIYYDIEALQERKKGFENAVGFVSAKNGRCGVYAEVLILWK